jgi:LPXTG-motif cell wall-anchored protein
VIVEPARTERRRRLPETGSSGDELVLGGLLVFLGGLFVAARPGRIPPR